MYHRYWVGLFWLCGWLFAWGHPPPSSTSKKPMVFFSVSPRTTKHTIIIIMDRITRRPSYAQPALGRRFMSGAPGEDHAASTCLNIILYAKNIMVNIFLIIYLQLLACGSTWHLLELLSLLLGLLLKFLGTTRKMRSISRLPIVPLSMGTFDDFDGCIFSCSFSCFLF